MNKLLSASEIAELKLPGLPTTKVAIASRAEREGWHCEERTGLGGTRRVYELPERYLQNAQAMSPASNSPAEQGQDGKVAGTIVAGSSQVNLEMLQLVEVTLEEWLQEKGLRLKPERRGAIVAVLYDYLAKGAEKEDLQRMLKAMTA